jgi:hypothetical protein
MKVKFGYQQKYQLPQNIPPDYLTSAAVCNRGGQLDKLQELCFTKQFGARAVALFTKLDAW